MRRILFASVFFILTLLLGVLIPFGNTNKAYAINANVILGTNDDEDYCSVDYCSGSDALKINQVTTTYATGAIIPLSINLINAEGEGGPSEKIGTTDLNVVNWTDLENTIWDSFYDSSFRTDGENGFFLVISKSKVTRTDDSFSAEVVGPGESFTISGPATNDQKIKTANGLGDNKGRSIGYLLYGIDPQTYFFNKLSFSPNVQITGLDPSTTYYAQIVVEEDGSGDYFWSNIVEFQTKATTDPEASPPEGTNATGYDQTQPPPPSADTVIDFGCSLGIGLGESNISGCFVELFYTIFWKVSAFILLLTGKLFDAIAAISLGSGIYSGQIATFVTSGWTIVRDIANIFFIFILLYTALGLVLSLHSVDPKKLISKVIITALLINFSLFFCRVVVDTSNILALNFYNAMDISTKGNEASTTTISTGVKEKSISGAVANGINPQKILSEDSLNNLAVKEPGTLFFVILIGTVLNFMLAWIFFMCAAFFAGRIGVIWLSMIFAPIALVTGIVPTLSKAAKRLGWEEWLSSFLKACFNAPIFMFFMYLIVRLTNETNLSETLMAATDSKNIILIVISVLLPAMIIIGLMQAAKKIAEEMAGEFGAAFSGIVAAGVGVAAMAATGGAAALGSRVIGGAAANIAKNDRLKGVASGEIPASKFEKWRAQKTLSAANSLKSASFDARQTGLGNLVSKTTGVNMNMGAGAIKGVTSLTGTSLDLSTGARAGGYDAHVARETEKEQKKAEMFASGYDEEKYRTLEGDIKNREKQVSDQEDVVSKSEDKIRDLNAQAETKPKNSKEAKDLKQQAAAEQTKLNEHKEKLRTLKKGTGEKVIEKDASGKTIIDPATGQPKTRSMSQADVGKKVSVMRKQPDGTEKEEMVDVDRNMFLGSMSQDSMTKGLENIKKARMKAYHHSLMTDTGREIHGTSRDQFGNITNVGHMSHDDGGIKQRAKRMFKDLGKEIASNAGKGLAAGLAASVVTGPAAIGIGVLGGGVAGLITGLAKNTPTLINAGDVKYEVAHHVTATEQHKHGHAKDNYKSPSSGFFDMFKGLGSSSGGGGSSHGGGHDDHGGGGHH